MDSCIDRPLSKTPSPSFIGKVFAGFLFQKTGFHPSSVRVLPVFLNPVVNRTAIQPTDIRWQHAAMREHPPTLWASSATYRRRCGSKPFGLKPVQVVTRHGQPAEGHSVASCGHPARRARPAGNPGCFRQPSGPSMSQALGGHIPKGTSGSLRLPASAALFKRPPPRHSADSVRCIGNTDCSAVLLRDGSCVTAIPPQGIPVAPRGRPRPALSAPRGDTQSYLAEGVHPSAPATLPWRPLVGIRPAPCVAHRNAGHAKQPSGRSARPHLRSHAATRCASNHAAFHRL